MIWFFDSWFWGLQSLKYFVNHLPNHDFIFLGDSKNAPYWDKSKEEIIDLTFKWLDWLFNNNAKIVILACNTASTYAIRLWQTLYPNKKVLSVTIPWVEFIIEQNYDFVTLLATTATIHSQIFEKKYFEITWKNINIQWIPAPKLVKLIESGEKNEYIIENVLNEYLSQINEKSKSLILWCTHYPIYEKYIKKNIHCQIPIVDPALESSHRFIRYLNKHDYIWNILWKNWKKMFYTTWDNIIFDSIGKSIMWFDLNSINVKY